MIWAMLALAIEPATICEIVDRPRIFEGKLVSLMAEVSVGFEMQKLTDPNCPSTPLWFEFAEGRKFPGAKKFQTITKRVTAEVIGRVSTGSCFGHNCFSKSQIVVEEFQGIASQRREPDSCGERRAELRVHFRSIGVWMDNNAGVIPLPDRSRIQLLGPGHQPLSAFAQGIFQLALDRDNVVELPADPVSGLLSLPKLAPGIYPFSAAGTGFQSVSGCVWIRRGIRRIHKIELEVGY